MKMKTRALTAREAATRLIEEFGYTNNLWLLNSNYIAGNAYTRRFGETTFTYANPRPCGWDVSRITWDEVGVRFRVQVKQEAKSNNILLVRETNRVSEVVANYNRMDAAGKKAFMSMLEEATIVEWPEPQRIRTGWQSLLTSVMGSRATWGFVTPDGVEHRSWEGYKYKEFAEGETYTYDGKPQPKQS